MEISFQERVSHVEDLKTFGLVEHLIGGDVGLPTLEGGKGGVVESHGVTAEELDRGNLCSGIL